MYKSSSVDRQEDLNTSDLHTQIDPFASKVTNCLVTIISPPRV